MVADGTAGTEADVVHRLAEAGSVFAEEEARILLAEAGSEAQLRRMLARRVAGDPLEQVVGWAEFCGLRVRVTEGVFVPRRRTELLVDVARRLARPRGVVVDLCCGSGAISAALAQVGVAREIHAIDSDPRATACAAANLHHLHARVYVGDLLAPLPVHLRGHVDTLVASPPYVPTAAIAGMPPEARVHEPRSALDGGPDGLAVLRRIVGSAPDWLAAGGRVLLEAGADQAERLVAMWSAAQWSATVHRCEERGSTVVVAGGPGT